MSDRDSDVSRRDLLRAAGASLTLSAGGRSVLSAQDAAHVHSAVGQERAAGAYKPKCFTAHEYATLRRLAELIVPSDEHSKGALDAGAPEFVDSLAANNAELAAIYTGGMAWLDEHTRRRYEAPFLDITPDQQTAVLDLIAYRKNEAAHPELGPGIQFFAWVRNMVVDAYYTSKVGMEDLGFMGNSGMAKFSVPEEAIQYAVKRSPLG
jgi:predicted Fe-Mo cluster-binding NifX family protein